MKKCMLAATSTQGEEFISLNLTTPTHYGDQKQFTTESITLDKAVAVAEAGAVQKTSFYLEFSSNVMDLLSLYFTLSGVSIRFVCEL